MSSERNSIFFNNSTQRSVNRLNTIPQIDGMIESFELGFRMQAELPQLLSIDEETKATKDLYGIGDRATDDFGRKCLLARRMVEAVCVLWKSRTATGIKHFNLKTALANNCESIDKPAAGLLADLESRGMLKDTLVIWSGEFGRTPHAQGDDGVITIMKPSLAGWLEAD